MQKSSEHEEESDAEGDTVDDNSKMLSNANDVQLRHCGFCGIEVSSTTD